MQLNYVSIFLFSLTYIIVLVTFAPNTPQVYVSETGELIEGDK